MPHIVNTGSVGPAGPTTEPPTTKPKHDRKPKPDKDKTRPKPKD